MDFSGVRTPSDDPPQCTATMENFYMLVIKDVIEKCGEHFGEDEEKLRALSDLQSNWTRKVEEHIHIQEATAPKLQVSKVQLPEPRSCDMCIQRQETKREFPHHLGIAVKAEPGLVSVKYIKEEFGQHNLGRLNALGYSSAFKDEDDETDDGWREVARTVPMRIRINIVKPPIILTVHVTREQFDANRIQPLFPKKVLEDFTKMSRADATEKAQALIDLEFKNHTKKCMEESLRNVENMEEITTLHVSDFELPKEPASSFNFQLADYDDEFEAPAYTIKPSKKAFLRKNQLDGTYDDDTDDVSDEDNIAGPSTIDPDSYRRSGVKIKVKEVDSDCSISDVTDDEDFADYSKLKLEIESDDELRSLLEEDEQDSEPDPNSNDDLTEEEIIETDNLILCQFTHVKRQKNQWKFRFENGIMVINGLEYLFQRASGEGTW